MIKKLFPIILLVMIILPLSSTVTAKSFESQSITDPYKPWTITFSHEINAESLTEHSIYIENSSNERHPISHTLSDDLKKIKVHPEKAYLFEEGYTLVITEKVSSVKGNHLKKDVTKEFSLQGNYILNIEAVLNPLVTNVKVQAVKDVAKVTMRINDGADYNLKRGANNTFSRGIQGLALGDQLLLSAFDANGNLVEEMPYVMTKK